MNRTEIESALDNCLLTDDEMSSDWSLFEDTLPPFISAD